MANTTGRGTFQTGFGIKINNPKMQEASEMAKSSGGAGRIGRLMDRTSQLARDIGQRGFLYTPQRLNRARSQLRRNYARLYELTNGFSNRG